MLRNLGRLSSADGDLPNLRCATAIRESLELGVILQKTVDEVGTALNVASCALRVEGQNAEQALTYFYFADERDVTPRNKIAEDLGARCARFGQHTEERTWRQPTNRKLPFLYPSRSLTGQTLAT